MARRQSCTGDACTCSLVSAKLNHPSRHSTCNGIRPSPASSRAAPVDNRGAPGHPRAGALVRSTHTDRRVNLHDPSHSTSGRGSDAHGPRNRRAARVAGQRTRGNSTQWARPCSRTNDRRSCPSRGRICIDHHRRRTSSARDSSSILQRVSRPNRGSSNNVQPLHHMTTLQALGDIAR
jgi:hypothetical protein